MDAVLSGQSGKAVLLGRPPKLVTASGTFNIGNAASIGRIFEATTDAKRLTGVSTDEVQRELAVAVSQDRTLRVVLMFLDPAEELADRAEYAALAEVRLAVGAVQRFVMNSLFAAPLPKETIDLLKDRRFDNHNRLTGMLDEIVALQKPIYKVWELLKGFSDGVFGSLRDRANIIESFISSGTIREIVEIYSAPEKADFKILQLRAKHRATPAAVTVISALVPRTAGQRNARRVHWNFEAEAETPRYVAAVSPRSGWMAYQNVRQQQAGIVAKLKERDVVTARKFAEELIAQQNLTSEKDQTAKSLSKLAQEAKLLGVPELQLEWSERATTVNPSDPRTFGHYADALIGLGRYAEASAALDSCEKFGGRLFALCGRARILRATHQYSDALAVFSQAFEEYPEAEGAEYAWVGKAEILRDLGRLEEALDEYRGLVRAYNLSPFVCGLASTLMDLGRLNEALEEFIRAEKLDSAKAVPLNGQGIVHRLAGRLDVAERVYNRVVADYPNDAVGRSGLAEVLRLAGRFQDAEKEYLQAVARAPYNPVPFSGLAELLRELGRIGDAAQVYASATAQFPYDERSARGEASILKSMGRYSDSLRKYDDVVKKFPFDIQSKVDRAGVLMHMGQIGLSHKAIDAVLRDYPAFKPAFRLKTVLLGLDRDWAAALAVSPIDKPLSQSEWSQYFVNSTIVLRSGDVERAKSMVMNGVYNTPFAKERRYFRSLLATIEMQRGHNSRAIRWVEAGHDDITNVVYLHAVSANQRSKSVKNALASLRESEIGIKYREVSSEIVRHYRHEVETPRRSKDWLFQFEQDHLMFEVAA